MIPDFLAKEIYNDMKNERVNIKEQQFNNLYIQRYYDVSILYADIKGFTGECCDNMNPIPYLIDSLCTYDVSELSGRLSAPALVSLLNDLFGRFDELASVSIKFSEILTLERLHQFILLTHHALINFFTFDEVVVKEIHNQINTPQHTTRQAFNTSSFAPGRG